jgi:DNA-binding NtrC family response regulator
MYALFSIYLIQAGFSSLDDDPTVRDFLFNYVRQYRHAKKVGEHEILGEILGRRRPGRSRMLKKLPPEEQQRLMRYTWPDDHHALRQYVSKTVAGVVAKSRRSERAVTHHESTHQPPFSTISLAAERLGVPRTTLYRYVKEGKVQTKQEFIDAYGKQQSVIPEEEICRLEQQKLLHERDEMLFQYCAEASGIKPKSLQRQVQRLKKQGNSAEVIRQHFQQDAQRRLQDSDT